MGRENTSSSVQRLPWFHDWSLLNYSLETVLIVDVSPFCFQKSRDAVIQLEEAVIWYSLGQIHSIGMRASKCPFVESQLQLLKIQFSPYLHLVSSLSCN